MAGRSAESRSLRERFAAEGEDVSRLAPIGTRPPLGQYIRQLWQRRHFIALDSRQRTLTQNARNRLGNVWLILRPLLDAAFYFVIFGLVLGATRGIQNYPAYIVIGILLFTSTSRALTSAPSTIQTGRAMIRAFSFPRASLPFAMELRSIYESLPAVAVMLVFIVAVPPHEWPGITWFLIAPILALQWLMNLGLRLILARIGFRFPDASHLMSFVARLLLYGSAVIFPIDRFLNHPTVLAIIEANPVFRIVSMARQVLMDGTVPDATAWMVLAGWSVGLFVVGFVYFWRGEASYGGGE